MLPPIAAILCFIFIIYVFRLDRRQNKPFSRGLWIPQLWFLLASSRYLSYWLKLGSYIEVDSFSISEGSPIDRAAFFILMAIGIVVLVRRRVDWQATLFRNNWVWLYFAFGAMSIVWSDFAFVAAKRLGKDMGNIVMVLIILTEKRPYEAAVAVLQRTGFLFLPLSLLFVKYYPQWGRAYHQGRAMFTGVATDKNGLGLLCLMTGIAFLWSVLFRRGANPVQVGKLNKTLVVVFLVMVAWLMHVANSATAFMCLVIAVAIMLVSCLPSFLRNRRRIALVVVGIGVCYVTLNQVFGVERAVIEWLGRDTNLTDRVPLWNALLEMGQENPIAGIGFESFFLGGRRTYIFNRFAVTNAHNGYLQVYLDLGAIGLTLVVAGLLSALVKAIKHLKADYPVGILRLCFVLIPIIYNWTEATLFGVSAMWIVLFLGMIEVRTKESRYPLAVRSRVVGRRDWRVAESRPLVPTSRFLGAASG